MLRVKNNIFGVMMVMALLEIHVCQACGESENFMQIYGGFEISGYGAAKNMKTDIQREDFKRVLNKCKNAGWFFGANGVVAPIQFIMSEKIRQEIFEWSGADPMKKFDDAELDAIAEKARKEGRRLECQLLQMDEEITPMKSGS